MTNETVEMADLFKGYTTSSTPPIITTSPYRFQHLLDSAQFLCDKHMNENDATFFLLRERGLKYLRYHLSPIMDVLSVDELNSFLQISTTFESHPSYPIVMSVFATKLIENGYQSGTNQYTLNLRGIKPLPYFGSSLNSNDGQSLDLVIYGELGEFAFHKASCNAYVERALEDFACDAQGNFAVWQTYTLRGDRDLFLNMKPFPEPLRMVTLSPVVTPAQERLHKTTYWQAPQGKSFLFEEKTETNQRINRRTQEYLTTDQSVHDHFIKNLLPIISYLHRPADQEWYRKQWRRAVPIFKRMEELFGGSP